VAGGAESLAGFRKAGLVPKAFPEVLHEIHPRLSTAFQALKDRSTVLWYRSHFVFADLTARPIQQFQVLIQRFPQSAVRPCPSPAITSAWIPLHPAIATIWAVDRQ